MSTICRSDYLGDILQPHCLKKVIKLLSKVIKHKIGVDNFDAFAYRGMSGAGVATTLGYLFNKPLVLIRKNEKSHSNRNVEGAIAAKRVVIVDDCIATGETLIKMVDSMLMARKKECCDQFLSVVAVVLYNDQRRNYHILPGEETLADQFRCIFYSNIRSDENYTNALMVMKECKVYSFQIYHEVKDTGKVVFGITTGTNLELDDLR